MVKRIEELLQATMVTAHGDESVLSNVEEISNAIQTYIDGDLVVGVDLERTVRDDADHTVRVGVWVDQDVGDAELWWMRKKKKLMVQQYVRFYRGS